MSLETKSKNRNRKTAKRLAINILYHFVKITGAPSALLWLRPRILRVGKTRVKGGVLISSNHRTFIDPIILHCTFPFRTLYSLATKDLYRSKIRTVFFTMVNCIKVDKENFSLSSFHEVVDLLQRGKAVVIFPEGQVNQTNGGSTLLTFKSGVSLMAHKSGAPILPVYITECKKWYHRQTVVIGEPIDVRSMLGSMPNVADLNRVSEHLRAEEERLQEYYEAWLVKKGRAEPKAVPCEIYTEKGEIYEHQHL